MIIDDISELLVFGHRLSKFSCTIMWQEKGFLHSRHASKGTQAEEKIASHKESVEKSGSLMLDIEIPTPAKHGEVVNSKNVSVPSPGKPGITHYVNMSTVGFMSLDLLIVIIPDSGLC